MRLERFEAYATKQYVDDAIAAFVACLSEHLSFEFGRGFGARTLREAQQFVVTRLCGSWTSQKVSESWARAMPS